MMPETSPAIVYGKTRSFTGFELETMRSVVLGENGCGGVLIRPTVVLSADHCRRNLRHPKHFEAFRRLRNCNLSNSKAAVVGSVSATPEVKQNNRAYSDLVLYKLKSPICGTAPVSIQRAAPDNFERMVVIGKETWGSHFQPKITSNALTLSILEIPAYFGDDFQSAWKAYKPALKKIQKILYAWFKEEKFNKTWQLDNLLDKNVAWLGPNLLFGASLELGPYICSGDSGHPMFGVSGEKMYLMGILESTFKGAPSRKHKEFDREHLLFSYPYCGGFYTFSKVLPWIDWIEKTIAENW